MSDLEDGFVPAPPSSAASEPAIPSRRRRTSIGRFLGRLIVPVPRGRGFRGKAFWVVRRVIYWYLIILVMLATFQRYLIYLPTRAETLDSVRCGFEPGRVEKVTANTADGLVLHGWFVRALPPSPLVPAAARQDKSAEPFTVIYFPGNAGHRGHRMIEMDLLSRLGADVYLFDYRGYGDNPGRPTEANLAGDARAVWDVVTKTRGTAPSRVVLLGESLGGGVATGLAAAVCEAGTPPAGLILRSTFTSVVDVASHYYPWLPVRLLLVDRFLSVDRIPRVTCPILILHGTQDTLIPPQFAERLFAAAPATSHQGIAKVFAPLTAAGHNDVLQVAGVEYRARLRTFFASLRPELVLPPLRQPSHPMSP